MPILCASTTRFWLMVLIAPVILTLIFGSYSALGQAAPTAASDALLPFEDAPIALAAKTCITAAGLSVSGGIPGLPVPVSDAGVQLLKCAGNVNGALSTKTGLWGELQTKFLNPLARFILRFIGREMKRQILNYIINGEFDQPRFVTNFELDARQAAENASRGYLSQLTGINFCNFFPLVPPAIYSINFNFQFQCTISSDLYAQYIKDPVSLTEVQRILAVDSSTSYIQTVISAGQNKAEIIAQAQVARAAQVSSGFIPDLKSLVLPADQAKYDTERAAAEREAYDAVLSDKGETDVEGNLLPSEAVRLSKLAGEAAQEAGAKFPPPKSTDITKVPGEVLQGLVKDTFAADILNPQMSKEFDEAVIEIAQTALGVMLNKGLNGIFGR